MNIKDDQLDTFGATLDQFLEVENISAGIVRGNVGIDHNGATIKDTTALAGAALNWIAISDEKLGMDIGDKRGITDGKTVLLRTAVLGKEPIEWQRTADSVAMAHAAFRAATGQEQDQGPLLLVDVATMEGILGNTLEERYGQTWRGLLGYEKDKLDVFGIVQAKEMLDTKNTGLEIYSGSWIGNVENPFRSLLNAKSPPKGTYINPSMILDEQYRKSSLVLNVITQVADYINHMGEPNESKDCNDFPQRVKYINSLLKGNKASAQDQNIAINIASGMMFIDVDSLLDYHRSCPNELENEDDLAKNQKKTPKPK